MTIVGIVLAAGGSARLGRVKQLVDINGEPLVVRTTRVLQSARVDSVAVVVGAERDAVAAAIAGLGVVTVDNAQWQSGMASSLRAGVAWARTRRAEAALICVCDQPRLTTLHLDALLADHEANGGAVGSRYAGVIGVPAVIPADRFDHVAALTGDRGAKAVLETARAIDWPDGVFDIDTVADLQALATDP